MESGEIYQTDGAAGEILNADGTAGLWKYPAGGCPTKTLRRFDSPLGVAVSRGRK
jgi:hypothetical protein